MFKLNTRTKLIIIEINSNPKKYLFVIVLIKEVLLLIVSKKTFPKLKLIKLKGTERIFDENT